MKKSKIKHDQEKTTRHGVVSETIRLVEFMKTMGVNRGYFVFTIL